MEKNKIVRQELHQTGLFPEGRLEAHDEVSIDLLGLIRLIESNLGKPAKLNWMPAQPGDVPITFADVSKARRLLGYEPRTPIAEGIRAFVEWYRGPASRPAQRAVA